MPNNTGVTTTELGVRNQILADVGNQFAIGCIVDAATVGVTVGNQKIAKAGTPVKMNLTSTSTPAVLATATAGSEMTGVLLHDVDVTAGNSNGTCLIFGFVNLNRIDSDVQAKIITAMTNTAATKLVTFLKV